LKGKTQKSHLQQRIFWWKVGRRASRTYQSGWSMLTLLPSVSIFLIQRAYPLVEDTVVRRLHAGHWRRRTLHESGALPPAKHLLCDLISNFFWEAQILAACCGSTAMLTEVLCVPDKAPVLLLCHVFHKLTEMSPVPLMRNL